MKIQQSLNTPTQWMVTRDDNEGYVLGYISLVDGVYQADGPKLHRGKGGMRERLGGFQTLDEAGKAIEASYGNPPQNQVSNEARITSAGGDE